MARARSKSAADANASAEGEHALSEPPPGSSQPTLKIRTIDFAPGSEDMPPQAGATARAAPSTKPRILDLSPREGPQVLEKRPEIDKPRKIVVPSSVDPLRDEFVALVAKLGASEADAEREYHILRSRFQAASQHEPVETIEHVPPLCIPEGDVPRFSGSASKVYQFLIDTYRPREGGEPLTLAYLRENDPAALKAFRNRRRFEEVPSQLRVLTVPDFGSRMADHLARHNVDILTETGIADAKRLMGTISKLVYGK